MYVNLNELRHRVTILRPMTTVDEEGNLLEDGLEPLDTVWAKILPYAAKISDGYAEKVDEVNYRIVIRYRNDVAVTDIVQWRGRRFQITAPPYDIWSNRQYTVLEVRELVEDGGTEI